MRHFYTAAFVVTALLAGIAGETDHTGLSVALAVIAGVLILIRTETGTP